VNLWLPDFMNGSPPMTPAARPVTGGLQQRAPPRVLLTAPSALDAVIGEGVATISPSGSVLAMKTTIDVD
jgi:hypothetical protein